MSYTSLRACARTVYACLAPLFCLTVLPLLLPAQAKNFSISPAPSWLAPYQPDLQRQPDLKKVRDGYYHLLVEEQQHAELKSTYRRVIRQIVSEAGIQNGSEISVAYDPAYEKLAFHQITVHREGQAIQQLQPGRFRFLQQEEDLSRFLYSGLYTAYCPLNDIRKGDRIEFAYTITGRNPIFEDKYSQLFYFAAYGPVLNNYQSLIASPARRIQFKAFNNADMPRRRELNGLALYEWKDAAKPVETPANLPSWYSVEPYVQASEYTSWQAIADWAQRINVVPPPGPALREKIAALKQEAGNSRMLYALKAIRFVQDDIRYLGIEMGAHSHRPHTPDKVLAQRFGDCKDKSLLLCTMLQADSIEAHMAYVHTSLKEKLADKLPTPAAFNHAIVVIRLDNRLYWIDPTISYQRGSLRDLTLPDYQLALVTGMGSNDLAVIHFRQPGKIVAKEKFILPRNNNSPAILEASTEYTGSFANNIRNQFANASISDQESAYTQFYEKLYGKTTMVDSLGIQDQEAGNYFTVIEKYRIAKAWTEDSTRKGMLVFTSQAQLLSEQLFYVADTPRTAPVALRYPYELEYTLEIETPENWQLSVMPLSIMNDYYRLSVEPSVKGNTVLLHYEYETYRDHIPASYIARHNRNIQQAARLLNFELSWNTMPRGRHVNRPVLLVNILLAGLFAWLAWRCYRRSMLPARDPVLPWPVGGWLWVLGVIVCIRPLSMLASFSNTGVFQNRTWQYVASAAGNGSAFGPQLYLLMEVGAMVGFWVFSILLLVLFIQRRDTFPRYMIRYSITLAAYSLLDYAVCMLAFRDIFPSQTTIAGLAGVVIGNLLWVPYLLRAERVRETFVRPYQRRRPPPAPAPAAAVAPAEAGLENNPVPEEPPVPKNDH